MKSSSAVTLVSSLGLSLVTSPFILTILALQIFTETLIELGEASEELFRSTRLPILHFPDFED